MKEVILTNKEKLSLQNELNKYKSYKSKQRKRFLTTVIVGNLIAVTVAFYNFGDRDGRLYLGFLILVSLMLISIGISFLQSKNRINKLLSDIKKGKKIQGKAAIKSINKFNRTIFLDNGIKGYKSIGNDGELKKGDIIKFKISPSKEYIFDFVKE